MILKQIFNKQDNPLTEETKTVDWNDFFEKSDAIVAPEKKPVVREPEITKPKMNSDWEVQPAAPQPSPFQARGPGGPLSAIDPTWKKNLSFLENEITAAEKREMVAFGKLEKARDELKAAEILHQDCCKKVHALKEAFSKLNSLVPAEFGDKSVAPVIVKKAAKKRTKVAAKNKKSNEND